MKDSLLMILDKEMENQFINAVMFMKGNFKTILFKDRVRLHIKMEIFILVNFKMSK